jgi:hypothetical protein
VNEAEVVSMRKSQRGVTTIGWIFLLIPVAVVGYAGIRLTPIYLNYGKVVKTIEQVAKESQSAGSMMEIRNAIERRVDIEGMTYPDTKDFIIRRDGKSWIIEIEYEDPVPLFGNIAIVPTFKRTARIGDAPG